MYLETRATTSGEKIGTISITIDLNPEINPLDLIEVVNFGPRFVFPNPFYQIYFLSDKVEENGDFMQGNPVE